MTNIHNMNITPEDLKQAMQAARTKRAPMKAMRAAKTKRAPMMAPITLARPAIPEDATVKWTHVDTRNIGFASPGTLDKVAGA